MSYIRGQFSCYQQISKVKGASESQPQQVDVGNHFCSGQKKEVDFSVFITLKMEGSDGF